VHGIPGDRRLESGDLVKLDVALQLNGWIADACMSVGVGQLSNQSQRLMDCSRFALEEAIKLAKPGLPVHQIGKAVQKIVEGRGFRVLRQLCGHGVGRTIHEEPVVPNFYEPRFNAILKPGMTLTIEPIIAESTEEVLKAADGWTLVTNNGCNSAHFEHTLLITEDEPEILTT
jgi:methionyl aminopeptidase